MDFGLDLAQQRLEWSEIVERAQLADEIGFTGIWGFDHFQPLFGEGPGNCFEGWTTLAALCGVTKRVRLGLLVTGNTYRHPAVLASQAITVDHASAGRLDLGIGAGWYEPEHTELGIPFPPLGERIDRFEEALEVVTSLMDSDDASFDGEHYQLTGATLRPRPVQSRPPIWIGASGEKRMLPLVARYADAWHSFGQVSDLVAKSRLLDEMARKAGREPSDIVRSASLSLEPPMDEIAERIAEWEDAGFDYLHVGWPPAGAERVRQFAERFIAG